MAPLAESPSVGQDSDGDGDGDSDGDPEYGPGDGALEESDEEDHGGPSKDGCGKKRTI